MTHDLMKNTLETLSFTASGAFPPWLGVVPWDAVGHADKVCDRHCAQVSMVMVTSLKDATYYGRVVYERRSPGSDRVEVYDVDARPSDAINLAVRFGAPIFINKVVVEAGAYPASSGAAKPSSGAGAAESSAKAKPRPLDSAIGLRMQLAVAVSEGRLGAQRFHPRHRPLQQLRVDDQMSPHMRADDAAGLARSIADVAGEHAPGGEANWRLFLAMELAVAEERYADAAALRDQLAAMNPELDQQMPPGEMTA